MHVSRFAKAAGSCAGNIIILIEIINRDYNYRSRSSREILNGKQDYAVSMITINGITMKVANKKLTTATKESSKEEEISLAIDIVYLLYFFSLFFFFVISFYPHSAWILLRETASGRGNFRWPSKLVKLRSHCSVINKNRDTSITGRDGERCDGRSINSRSTTSQTGGTLESQRTGDPWSTPRRYEYFNFFKFRTQLWNSGRKY